MIRIEAMKLWLPPVVLLLATLRLAAQPENEEYSVYKALLQDRANIVVSTSTMYSKVTREHRKMLEIVDGEILSSYKRNNAGSFQLQSHGFGSLKVALLSNEEVKPFYKLAEQNDLKAEDEFFKKFGSRELIYLSRVGFNKASSRALINVTYAGICGTCSESYFVLLDKFNGKWLVLRRTVAWMS